jgi:lysophospholipase L1-like esterase
MKCPHGILLVGLVLGISAVSAGEQTTKAAWTKLVGNFAERAAFTYVENDASLPNVFIYGDSISIGYTPEVRAALAGKANVYRIHLNGGPSGSVIGKLDTMESTMRDPALADAWGFAWDVIHINVGLHDLKYVNDQNKLDVEKGKQVASIGEYQVNLRRIIARLQEAAPDAKLIFALTTKVPAESNGRHENGELAYNAAALEVLKRHPEIAVNDLRTASLPWEQLGNVHFKPDGIAAQAEHVAGVIAGHLPR